jgi:hypothetical protein
MKLPESELLKNINKGNAIDWTEVPKKYTLSEKFVLKYSHVLNWRLLWIHQRFPESFIRTSFENNKKEYSDVISTYQVLSENFIREFKDYVNWVNISYDQVLSESFIREFKDMVSWAGISERQILSESFIREFKHKVFWGYISHNQKFEDEFVLEFLDILLPEWVLSNPKLKLSDQVKLLLQFKQL